MSWRDKLIYAVVLILVVIPLYPKFPLVGVSGSFVAVRLEDMVIAAVVGGWLVLNLNRVKAEIWGEKINRSIILYWILGLVSVFSAIFVTKSADFHIGILHWLRRVEYMALFMVAATALKSREQLHLVVRVMVAVAAIVAVYGVGQLLFNFPVISTNNSEFSKGLALSLGPGARINSTFAGHYDLAAYSLFPLLLIIGLLTLRPAQPDQGKLVLLGVGGLIYWAMLLSASRVTFAAFFISSGLLLWWLKRPKWLWLWAAVAVVSVWLSPQLAGRYRELITNQLFAVVAPVSAAVDEELPDALKPPAQPEDRSLNIRLHAEWPKALRAVVKNPILGTGFSSVGLAVDNDYLRSLAETGILGTLALGLVFIRLFKQLKPGWKSDRNLAEVFSLAITCGLIGLLVNAVFIDVFEASKVAILTWTMLGLAVKIKSLPA